MYKEVFQVVKYPCHPYCITYRFVASCASTNSETAAPLDSTLLDSLGVILKNLASPLGLHKRCLLWLRRCQIDP